MNNNYQNEVQTKLTRGLLDMIILQYLDHESMYGYQLITKIRKGFGINVGPSSVYPVLRILEKKGYVKSAWNMDTERPRKVFTLTKEGKSFLSFTESSLSLILKKMVTEYKIQIQASRIPCDRLTC